GGAQLGGLLGATHDLLEGEEIAFLLAMVAAEGAEGAVFDADVGEVDVAIHHVGDHVADLPPPELVGDQGERLSAAAVRLREGESVGDRQLAAVQTVTEDAADGGGGPVQPDARATSVASAHSI